ncbi:hypothetical protein ACVSQB_17270 [Bradyrhizobium elkanii]
MPALRSRQSAQLTTIPSDFPHPQRLGGRDLYLTVLGNPATSTFARWLAEGKIPKPQKLGSLNRWPETVMADTRDVGIA